MIRTVRPRTENDYPTSDGKPMAETDIHRDVMVQSIWSLDHWFADEPMVYVSGNLLVYYVPGNKRKHLAAWWERVSNRPTWRRVARTGPQPYEDGVTADVVEKQFRR